MNTIKNLFRRLSLRYVAASVLMLSALGANAAQPIDAKVAGFADKYAQVNGVRIHYKLGGKGTPVVLLHGYGETSHMWVPAMKVLVKNHTVIVPDLRGAGRSEKATSGYDKKNMAVDIHELVKSITNEPAAVVGHDIGMMVAYAAMTAMKSKFEGLQLAGCRRSNDYRSARLVPQFQHLKYGPYFPFG